ncbi:vegetative cell wall protein, partial [Streptomyces olivaceoviridis]
LRERAERIAAQAATTSASASGSTSAPSPKRSATSASTSGSVSPLGGRGAKKQAEVEAVLARLVGANDPKAYPLSEVMADFGLTQTTAYDRLVTAQRLYEAAQNSKSEKTA